MLTNSDTWKYRIISINNKLKIKIKKIIILAKQVFDDEMFAYKHWGKCWGIKKIKTQIGNFRRYRTVTEYQNYF